VAAVLRINVVPRAQRDIREALSWWRENRPKAPRAMVDELRRAFHLLRVQPEVGTRAQSQELPGVRRIHLGRVRYHVYYRVDLERHVVDILAVWHSSRGAPPPVESIE
jgi:plasmid stabilization system protein ParE